MKNFNWRIALTLVVIAAIGALAATLLVRSFAQRNEPVQAGFVAEPPEPLPVLYDLPEFELTDQFGGTVALGDLEGKIWVADFIFTRCQGVCPMLTKHMLSVQTALSQTPEWDEDLVRIVSFTVDPEHDTPDVLLEYATNHQTDPARWLFLTGERGYMWNLLEQGFKLPVAEDPTNQAMPITHTSKFVLVDEHGAVRGYYDSMSTQDRLQLLEDIRQLVTTQRIPEQTEQNASAATP